jgi:hypothetical protein
MTSSHSSSLMLNSMRSRRIPAMQTTPSIDPQASTAVCTTSRPPSIVETSPATAMAVPPAASISATTFSATSLVGLEPSMATPWSATTTLAPWSAQARATARPIPPPPPVIAMFLPSSMRAMPSSLRDGPPDNLTGRQVLRLR